MPYLAVTVTQDGEQLFFEYVYVPESEQFVMIDNALHKAKQKNLEIEAGSKEEAIIKCMRRDGVSTWYSNDDWTDYGEEAYRVTEL